MMKHDAGLITSLPASDLGNTAARGSKKINYRLQSCLCLIWSGYPSNDVDEFPTSILGLVLRFKSECLVGLRCVSPLGKAEIDNLFGCVFGVFAV